jgi:hypothetical protein
VLQDSPGERRKLDSGRKRWTTKWVAGELAIARRLLLRTRDAGQRRSSHEKDDRRATSVNQFLSIHATDFCLW